LIVQGVSALPFDEPAGSTAPPAFGAYRVLHQIGSGVLGPVFRTYDPHHDRLVAVKAFKLDLPPQTVARLADALRRLIDRPAAHPAIVRVIDAGLEGTMAFVAMEYASGESLDVSMRSGAPLAIDRAMPLLSEVAAAIDAAWAAGAGHGALHPRDILVAAGSNDLRITGVGIVQALESIGAKLPLRRPYAAPERVAGHSWDVRADVYSLGVIAHELLTGRRPTGHEQDGVLAPGVAPEARVRIRRVLAAALTERPEDRLASATAFVNALAAALRGEAVDLPAPAPVPGAPLVTPPVAEPAVDLQAAALREPEDALQLGAEFWTLETESKTPHPAVADAPLAPRPTAVPAAQAPSARTRVAPPAAGPTVVPTPVAGPVAPPPAPPAVDPPPMPREDFPAEGGLRPPRSAAAPAPPPAVSDRRDLPAAAPAQHRPTAPALASGSAPRPDLAAAPLFRSKSDAPSIAPPRSWSETDADRHPYPWLALISVAIAGLVVGGVGGYRFALTQVTSAPAPAAQTAAARTDTDVPVSPDARTQAPAAPPSALPGAPAPVTPPPSPATAPPDRTPTRVVAPKGRLVVRSSPPGALVFVDGKRQGEPTPATLRDLPLGPHTVQVARAGYVPQSESIVLSAAQPIHTMAVVLQPGLATDAPMRTGSVFLDSTPRGARVSVDGRFVGLTPLSVPELAPGEHTARFELGNLTPLTSTVTVKPGTLARLVVTLK